MVRLATSGSAFVGNQGRGNSSVIISVEPTHDNDDICAAWLAHSQAWAQELHSCTGSSVQLQLIDEPLFDGIEFDAESVIIADLFWRDATLNQPNEVL